MTLSWTDADDVTKIDILQFTKIDILKNLSLAASL